MSRTHRVLAAEQLEQRCVLSLAPLVPEPLPEAHPQEVASRETSPSQDAFVPSLAAYLAQEPIMGPIAPPEFAATAFLEADVVDQVFHDEAIGEGEGLGSTLCSTLDIDCECENLPPTIVNLGLRVEGDFLVIFGDVQDDQIAAGYPVGLSGLTTEQALTDEDGHFELRIALPLTSGFIFVIATDLEGGVSGEVSTFFDPE